MPGRLGHSLKARLLGLVLAAIVVIWLGTAVFSYLSSRREVGEILDAHLAQAASLLIAQVGVEGLGDERGSAHHERRRLHLEDFPEEHAPSLHRQSRKVAFQVWEGGRLLRLHSENAPDLRLLADDEGFGDSVVAGERWRVFSAWDPRRQFVVQVGERVDARDALVRETLGILLKPLVVALPLLAALIWFAVGSGLKPLRHLTAEVARRDPRNLAPLAVEDAPREVAPLVAQLDALFARVGELIGNERRFTADASHELRTPLAAIRAQAQVALGATADAERQRALEQVISGCDRAKHLVEQLLTLARLEVDDWRERFAPVDLSAVAAEVVAEIAPTAIARDVEVAFDSPGPCACRGDAGLLRVLLRNLVDNAVRYSPSGASVHVGVRIDAGVRLTVADDGPGIPTEERENVMRRFYRVLGTQAPGSGLGLSIVARIAEIHGAVVDLSSGDGGCGLVVNVAFPDPGASGAR